MHVQYILSYNAPRKIHKAKLFYNIAGEHYTIDDISLI